MRDINRTSGQGRDQPADNTGMEPRRPLVSRRTIAKGAAWAVPVIAVGAPVPAMAASGCISGTVTATPGVGSGADMITVVNTGPGTIPAGTTVMFRLRNNPLFFSQFTPDAVSGVDWVGTSAIFLTPGQVINKTLTVTADVPPGGTIWWQFGTQSHWWTSYTNITPEGGCGTIEGCASLSNSVPGMQCA